MITYTTGDATRPVGKDNKLIVHICNDAGAWGAGFVMAISRRWKQPAAEYRKWFRGTYEMPFELGNVQPVQVEPTIWVCNLLGQHDVCSKTDQPPIRYTAVQRGLKRVAQLAETLKASIHMPRIGCGLAGGTWDRIEPIIQQELADAQVTVYDLPPFKI